MKEKIRLCLILAGLFTAFGFFASCTKDVQTPGSITLDASELVNQIITLNTIAEEAEGDNPQQGNEPSGYEGIDMAMLESSLKSLIDQNFIIKAALTLSGDYTGTSTKNASAWTYIKNNSPMIEGEEEKPEPFTLEINNVPVDSSVEVELSVWFEVSQLYQTLMESAIENYFSVLDGSKDFYDGIKQQLVYQFSANRYKDLKFVGKTNEPVLVKAGENHVDITMEQTDGFIVLGGTEISLADNDSLELLVENQFDDTNGPEDTYIKIYCAGSDYEIVRVGYLDMSKNWTYLDLDESTEEIEDSLEIKDEEGRYWNFSIVDNKLIITPLEKEEENDEGIINTIEAGNAQSFFTGSNSFTIIARNKYTGQYKTAVYKGL